MLKQERYANAERQSHSPSYTQIRRTTTTTHACVPLFVQRGTVPRGIQQAVPQPRRTHTRNRERHGRWNEPETYSDDHCRITFRTVPLPPSAPYLHSEEKRRVTAIRIAQFHGESGARSPTHAPGSVLRTTLPIKLARISPGKRMSHRPRACVQPLSRFLMVDRGRHKRLF